MLELHCYQKLPTKICGQWKSIVSMEWPQNSMLLEIRRQTCASGLGQHPLAGMSLLIASKLQPFRPGEGLQAVSDI